MSPRAPLICSMSTNYLKGGQNPPNRASLPDHELALRVVGDPQSGVDLEIGRRTVGL